MSAAPPPPSSSPSTEGEGATTLLEASLGALRVAGDGQGPPSQQPQPQQRRLVPGSTVPRHHHAPQQQQGQKTNAAAAAATAATTGDSAAVAHAWGPAPAAGFPVRAAHYKRLGKKAPGVGDFYELVSFDWIQTPRGVVDHVARGMDLSGLFPSATHPELPPLFVLNCQLPDTEPALHAAVFGGGGAADDGPSRSAVFVFAVRAETVAALKGPPSDRSPALALLTEYFRRAPGDADFRGRFKVIASCRNLEALALPAFIANYNGKPVLITKSGTLWHGPQYAEMDINVRMFSFLARKGLAALKPRFAQMVLDVAFLVEGRGDEELPEQLLGCARLHRLGYEEAAPYGDGVLPVPVPLAGGVEGGRAGAGMNGSG